MKVSLPNKPVDGYEIAYFSIQYDRIETVRLVYHRSTKWNYLFPETPGGADIVDQWQVFRGGNFEARMDGWFKPVKVLGCSKDLFADRNGAIAELRELLSKKAERHERLSAEIREQIKELE